MNWIRWTIPMTIGLGCLLLSCGPKSASDQALTTDIQAKLYADAATKPANINVSTSNGVVTLSGNVPSSDAELQAMKIANGTQGVRRVDDQMKVTGAVAANELPNAGNPGAPSPPVQPPPSAAQPAPPPEAAAPASAPAADTSQPTPPPVAEAAPPEPVTITIPAGEEVSVRTIDSINSAQNTAGQVFRASLYAPLVAHGRTIVPAGSRASVILTQAKSAGRIKGSSELEVQLSSIEYRGRTYPVQSTVVEQQGKGRGKQTGVRTGVGAGVGAVIGAIAGGGKGAAIGSVAGGGAGFGSALFTHGQQVKIPSETVLTFTLRAPLRIRR